MAVARNVGESTLPPDRPAVLPPAQLRETIYRLDGPLRWALGEGDALLRRIDVRPGDTVLDVGAGTGYLTLPAARWVGAQGAVYSMDVNRELLSVLEHKAERAGLETRVNVRCCTATELPWDEDVFDHVVSSYLLHELPEDAPAVLAEIYRVLRPGGRVALADYRRVEDEARRQEIESWYARQDDGAGDDEVHLRFALADLERLFLDAGFRCLALSTWHEFHVHVTARK